MNSPEPSMSDSDPGDDMLCARGGWVTEFTTRPSSPPLYLTTAFDLESLEHLDAVAAGQRPGYIYTRDANPNHDAFAADLARLERAEAGLVCSSGMGAMTAVLLGMLRSGEHVIAARVLYGRTLQLLQHLQSAFGVSVSLVDANDPAEFQAAVRPETRLAIVESISNPLMEVADLPAIAAGLGEVPLLVDSTFATPCLLRPIDHGARIVFHSASKYLNGHGDVMLGVLAGSAAALRRPRQMMALLGTNSNPFECWLASRGLRTLPIRMRQVSETAQRIAEFLAAQPGVLRVFYPGLATHPSHAIARRMLTEGCGGMLAFEIAGGREAVSRLFQALHPAIPFSPTLADARTTVSYPAGTSHKFMSPQDREVAGISAGLVRLSIGLEDAADLQRELGAALARLH